MSVRRAPSGRAIACVTVTYNSAPVLADFLESLDGQTGVDLCLYAVDNASADSTCDILEAGGSSVPLALIRNASNDGVARGNNIGMRAAIADGFEWLLLINNDTLFEPTAISDLLDVALTTGERIVVPTIEAIEPPGTAWYAGGTISMWRAARPRHDDIHRPIVELSTATRATDYAPTCVMLLHKSVLAEVGMMDEGYFVYSDDVDFAIRAKRAGVRYILAGSVLFTHKINGTTGPRTGPFRARWETRNWVRCGRKHATRAQLATGVVYIYLWCTLRLLTRRENWLAYRTRLAAIHEGLTSSADGREFGFAVSDPPVSVRRAC